MTVVSWYAIDIFMDLLNFLELFQAQAQIQESMNSPKLSLMLPYLLLNLLRVRSHSMQNFKPLKNFSSLSLEHPALLHVIQIAF